MARLPYLKEEQLPEDYRALFARINQERGFVPLLHQAMANAPVLLDAFLAFTDAVRGPGALPAHLKELAILTVAAETDSPTIAAAHRPAAVTAGLTEAQIAAAGQGSTVPLEGLHLAVTAYARAATRATRVDEATWRSAADRLGNEAMAELVFVVAFYNMVARFLGPVAVDLDPRYGALNP
jgi:alkylhydroperoxidase family enzyme